MAKDADERLINSAVKKFGIYPIWRRTEKNRVLLEFETPLQCTEFWKIYVKMREKQVVVIPPILPRWILLPF